MKRKVWGDCNGVIATSSTCSSNPSGLTDALDEDSAYIFLSSYQRLKL